ncbi:Porin-like protein NicP precursor [compost metagenome]
MSSGSNFTQLNQGALPDKGAGGSSLYLYTDRLIQSFTRAGERTVFGQYAYDFVALGVPGLKASVMYLSGGDIKTTTGSNQKEWERDISLDYALQSGPLKGLGFGWRNGKSNSEASRNQEQNRLIVSYNIPLL